MGPRPDGRGRSGAAGHVRLRRPASMGPRPDGRGRVMTVVGPLAAAPRQWGRDRMAAEGPLAGGTDADTKMRQWGRDRMAAEGGRGGGPALARGGVNGAATGWPRKDLCDGRL